MAVDPVKLGAAVEAAFPDVKKKTRAGIIDVVAQPYEAEVARLESARAAAEAELLNLQAMIAKAVKTAGKKKDR